MICSDNCSLHSTENQDNFFNIFSRIRFFPLKKALLECTVNLFFNHPPKSKSHDWTRLDWTRLDWTRLNWTRLDWTRLDWTRLTGLMYQMTSDETQSKPHHTMSQ